MAEWIELVFDILDLYYTVLKGNSSISKNKGSFLWNFVPNSKKISQLHTNHQKCRQLRRTLNVISWRWSSVTSL